MDRTAIRSHRFYKTVLFYLFVICVMLFCGITASARELDTEYGTVSAAAMISEKKPGEITVTLTPDEAFLNSKKGETLYLFILSPHETADNLRTVSPTATKVVDKTVTFSVTADDAGERYRAKYIFALGEGADYCVLGEAYVENPEVLAENTTERTTAAGIKGLTVSQALMADAELLGISHAVIPVVIDDYLTGSAGDPQYSTATAGVTSHFDPTKVAQLDAQIAALRETGVHIYLRFVLDGSDRNTTEPTAALYGLMASDGSSFYGITLESKLAYQTANNVFSFFAGRYASESGVEPIDFILGYQVNEWGNYYDLGIDTKDTAGAAEAYADVFRLCDAALRSQSENSRVFVPLSNLLASAKPFLSAFAEEMGADTAWSVAVAPYASDPMDDSIWDDDGSTDSENSTYLTMENLSLLGGWLKTEELLYTGKMRSVIIDDFAVHGTSGDTASQERQAASFVYAYYRVTTLDYIEAFVWHRVTDGAAEHCSLGLRQLDSTEKPVYRLFMTIDTETGTDAAAEYAKIVGEKKWSKIIKGFSAKDTETAARYEGAGTIITSETFREDTQLLLDFLGGTLGGFVPGVHTAKTEVVTLSASGTLINTQILQAETYPAAETEYAGITKTFSADELPQNTKTLYLTLRADPADSTSDTVPVCILLGKNGKNGTVSYTGTAEIPAGAWTTLSFDISDYMRKAKSADYMKLYVGGLSSDMTSETVGEDGVAVQTTVAVGGTFSVNELRYVTGSGGIVLAVFKAILVILLILVVLFALLVLRAQLRRRKRRKQMAMRRAEMLRRERMRQMQNAQYAQSQNAHAQNAQNQNTYGAGMRNRNAGPGGMQYTGGYPDGTGRGTQGNTPMYGNSGNSNPANGTHPGDAPRRRTAQRRPDMYDRR